MSETDQSVPLERRPACDNCKTRKTKCDRRSPCASCVTLNVACRSTRRAPEKRQRVVLSSKYDEAVQDVSKQLGDVKEMLQALMLHSKDGTPHSTADAESSPSSDRVMQQQQQTHNTPPPMIDEQVPSLFSVHEGFNGDSSFQSHAHRVQDALEATLAASELINAEALEAAPSSALSPRTIAELLNGADTRTTPGGSSNASDQHHHAVAMLKNKQPLPRRSDSENVEFGKLPLPPLDVTLKLLRLLRTEKQRFFVDMPIFREDEFIEMCRGVYFATEPISIWTWIAVNVGLYYLFFGSNAAFCGRMGTTLETVRSHCSVLRANAEAAMQSLRLCSEPSTESCRALALLGTFYVKEGHSTIAWRIFSTAARACLDLGLHRIPNDVHDEEFVRQREVFWYIYMWEKGMAITCGRTPIIHHYDVTTGHPAALTERRDLPLLLYGAFGDYAILAGEIQRRLFSASAWRASQEERIAHVRRFAGRIMDIQGSVRSEDPNWGPMFDAAAALIDIKMYSLLTLVYRILPPSSPQSHPLQCSDECIDAARRALSVLLRVGEAHLQRDPAGWSTLLNVILSLVPFVSFIVLAGNAIATSSSIDLALLSSILSIMAPIAADSPNIGKIHDACERFGRVATLIVSSTKEYRESNPGGGSSMDGSSGGQGMSNDAHGIHIDYSFPMAQHDWDSAMTGFESELGDWDSRALTSTIEPYIANTGW